MWRSIGGSCWRNQDIEGWSTGGCWDEAKEREEREERNNNKRRKRSSGLDRLLRGCLGLGTNYVHSEIRDHGHPSISVTYGDLEAGEGLVSGLL